MQSARLIVKNFGPLKDVNIEVRDFLCLIGKQATGKSTIAKLIAIFEDENFRKYNELSFEKELEKYNMFNFFSNETEIIYLAGSYSFLYSKGRETKINLREFIKNNILKSFNNKNYLAKDFLEDFEALNKVDNNTFDNYQNSNFNKFNINFINTVFKKINVDKEDTITESILKQFLAYYDSLMFKYGIDVFFDSQYIPSERSFLHIIAENTLGLINNDVKIPKHLLEIGQEYEKALNVVKEIPLNLIDKKYSYKREGKSSYIYHNKEERTDLLQSASGLQSIIPIILLIEYAKTLKENYHFNYVVEEPELNIYPETQYELIKYLVKNIFDFKIKDYQRKKMVITTHSPYILASINNLLLAFEKGKKKPDEVNKIIKKESWINPDFFNVYELRNGKSYKIMNDSLSQIKSNIIDNVTDKFSNEFDKLLAL